jgi:hypothetical protein
MSYSSIAAVALLTAAGAFAPQVAAQQVVVVNCESVGGRQQYCEVETRYGVRLVEEFSRGNCREGETWGYDAGRIWVRGGCRAAFELGTGDVRGDRQARDYIPRYDQGQGTGGTLLCESRNNRRQYCRANVRGGQVVLVRAISRTACDEGYNWGYDEGGVWVDAGCAAEFAIETGSRYGRRGNNPGAYGGRRDVVSCESEDFRRQFCSVGRAQTTVLVRQRSKAACIENRTWGYDGRSIWVDQGCAGDFEVVR